MPCLLSPLYDQCALVHAFLFPVEKKTAQQANEEAILRCKQVMEEHKARLAAPVVGKLAAADLQNLADPNLQVAVSRWGPRVLQVADVADWAAYVESRTSTPPPGLPSPYALLQERYAFDPWCLLVACVLMSRVSSAEVKERCISGFFELCPTPSAFLDTDPELLLPVLRSLGLFPNRLAALVDVTQR